MTQLYTIEHYNVCGLVVAAVKAPDNRVLQTWAADPVQKIMVRDASLIGDIECDSRVRPLSKMAFDAYCAQNNIEDHIPEAAIMRTLRLHGLVMPEASADMHSPLGAYSHSMLAMSCT